MNFQLVTEAPSWMLVLCPMAGLLYAWILYRKETTFSGVDKWVTLLMSALKFLVVSMLVLLLLSPLIKSLFTQTERPLIILLQDGSRSLLAVSDSASVKQKYPEAIVELKKELEKDFDVRPFTIGDKLSEGLNFDFTSKQTDLSAPLAEIRSRFAGRNLGAVILASDGIFNKGTNPGYSYPELKVPVYTIGLGDTTVRKDLLIARVDHNKTAFSGNTFPVEITVDARQCAGHEVKMSVLKNGAEVYTKAISITTGRFNQLIPVFLEAGAKGINHYIVKISTLEGEITFNNNQKDFFVEVIDSRQKVLVLANAPHPDISVLKNLLETNPNYEVKTSLINEFDGIVSDVNIAILHQLPSKSNPATELIQKLSELHIPVLFILGSQSNVAAFNTLNTGIKITDNNGSTNEVMAEPIPDFPFFTMEEEQLRKISSFPPLVSPFGNYNSSGANQVLLNQRIGAVKTGLPLLLFSTSGEQKIGVFAGEGLWKWKLREYAENNSIETVSALMTKTVQYLATTEKKTPFRIFYKNNYFENEVVTIDAEFYNEAGELVNINEAQVTITDENKNNYPFTFSRTGKSYSLQAGNLPVGSYSFSASTVSGKKTFIETGGFTISALQAELSETIADHRLLATIAEKTGGQFFLREQLLQIANQLKNKEEIKTISYTQKKLDEVINIKLIFVLLILLLSIEWFMRKRSGGY